MDPTSYYTKQSHEQPAHIQTLNSTQTERDFLDIYVSLLRRYVNVPLTT